MESPGPVIFKQERIGKNKKTFKMYKFRSMVTGADKMKKKLLEQNEMSGPMFKMKEDPRVTKVGKFIRKTSIDELPQLINILKGEMSFIGPRPWVPEYYNNFTEEQKKRVTVLPGITGLAQANGRNAINVFEKINLDVEYTNKVTFAMDCKVIIDTIKTVYLE